VDPIAGLSMAQRVGQVFMVGTPASTAAAITKQLVSGRHVGNIFLSGRSRSGVAATAAVVAQFRALVGPDSTGGEPLLVATDQEGGEVQVLHGPGFSSIPTGVAQSRLTTAALAAGATGWGNQLAAAGVNMDLAPVVDVVASPATARQNPPIGGFQREIGFVPSAIAAHAAIFRDGMGSAHVITVDKHFPGLGLVGANTDNRSGVTDRVTASSSPSVGIYRTEIAAGLQCVMVSSATYSHIDPKRPGVFSPAMVTGLLRKGLGFDGVIMTDDVSAARQTLAWSPASRAILSLQAGVDLVLVSDNPAVAAQMVDAVLAKANADPAFAEIVNNAARRVVELKAANGLVVAPAAPTG
jgi:beta-N-acetylhexosaminidase